jgi:hypothetical protein
MEKVFGTGQIHPGPRGDKFERRTVRSTDRDARPYITLII